MNQSMMQKLAENKYSKRELTNLLSNAEKRGRVDIIPAIKESLKVVDKRSYSVRYVKPIREKVQEIVAEIASENEWGKWSENGVSNGVKPGGEMINGELLAEYYISFKKKGWKKSAYLSVYQRDERSMVGYAVQTPTENEYKIYESSEEAIYAFKAALSSV